MKRHHPFMQGNMAILEDRSDRDGELLSARRALDDLTLSLGRWEPVNLSQDSAVRAERAIRPSQFFQILARRVLIVPRSFS